MLDCDELVQPNAEDKLHTTVFQQSTTLTAKMWPPDMTSSFDWNWNILGWQMNKDQFSVIIICTIIVIVLISTALVFIIWYCCFCNKKTEENNGEEAQRSTTNLPGYSTVFLDPKTGNFVYSNRIVELFPEREGSPDNWFFNDQVDEIPPPPPPMIINSSVPRSASVPPIKQLQSFDPCIREIKKSLNNVNSEEPHLNYIDNETQHNPKCPMPDSLPQISEFNPQQFTSSSFLDNCEKWDGKSLTMRTRSLPANCRSKKRPFSTSDNINELYAKVNFSKKRKNRMRNDEAAIIAMSKSRSQFLNNKDTDVLVENEAVIVYDERTAL
ncbi:uncharacterized protein LOC126898642 isoform X2 [Daktulosphaira vitifoliae]|uniref:uncharacterized protein LOC126898642 isoform X2 n=1 Tax=Daktulosphaira vitifoliae TaxID=58002 RepID=UPI0021AA209C|nr:uncharacterized protein LOC126898642 isoform X2 [Daktulosphaira vitifoliae]